jgi:tetratricopeptide (TPR) repeat protein
VSSPRFKVVTDLSTEDAQRAALELEQGVAAIEQVAFEHSRAALQPTTVVVFSSDSDFHAFAPELVEGRFFRGLPGELEADQFALLHGALSSESRLVCLHELTHDLFERNFGPAPPWLREGWAQYYSTIQVEPDRVRLGGALPSLTFTPGSQSFVGRSDSGASVFAMAIDLVPPPSVLLRMDYHEFYREALLTSPTPEDSERATALYLGSWALVHMLHDGPAPYPARYAQFLNNVRSSEVQPAWEKAFAGLSDSDFDRDFKRYLARGQLALFEYRARAYSPPALRARVLSDAEVHILWARIPSESKDPAIARRELDEAVAEAPHSAESRYFRGLFWLKQNQLVAAERDLLAAAQVEPSEPRYLLGVLILRIRQSPAAEPVHEGDAIMQAALPLARVAKSPVQFRVLAELYQHLGQLDRALEYAERAAALAPIGSAELDTEAEILGDLGRVDDALRVQRLAVAFLPERADGAALLRHLRDYERRAGAAKLPSGEQKAP